MSSIALHPVSSARPVREAATTDLRLTRRGRLVVTLLFLAMVLALFTTFGSQVVASGEAGSPVPTTTVVVGDGDTLWGIASAVAEPGETRSMVQRIVELNSLAGVTIHAGQELAVPAP